MTLTDTDTDTVPLPAPTAIRHPSALGRRLHATGRAAVIAVTSFAACALLPLWLTAAALTPLTVVAPLLVPATWLVRRYADAHRRSAGTVLGTPVAPPYRVLDRPGVISRVLTVLRDPASWRDALWLFVHAVVGASLSLLSVVLLLGTVFYLIFPFLFAVTPPAAFGTAFGVVTIDSVGEAFALVPLAVVAFGLWWWTALPLSRAVARTDRALLGTRTTSPRRPFAA